VPEVAPTRIGVVSASATAEALDALVVPGRAIACRVAADELLLLCAPDVSEEVARETGTRLTVLDPDALVVDSTDGWSSIELEGDGARMAFSRLSSLELPDAGFVQGEVVHVPAKVVVDRDRVRILVSSMWERHLHDRVAALLRHTARQER